MLHLNAEAAVAAVGSEMGAESSQLLATEAAVATADAEKDKLSPEALAWASSSNDDGVISSLQKSLPEAVIEEQIQAYRAHKSATAKAAVVVSGSLPPRILVYPHLLKSRMQAAARYAKHLKDNGCQDENGQAPRGVLKDFINNQLVWKRSPGNSKIDPRLQQLRRWLKTYRTSSAMQGKVKSRERTNKTLRWEKRERALGAGRRRSAPIARQYLYEWFISMRFPID